MSKKTHDLVATVGSYTDRQTGEEKKRFKNCGFASTNDKGQISIMIDALPLSREWEGWLNLYPLRENRENNNTQTQPQQQQQPQQQPQQQQQASAFDDDDIPF